MSDQLLRTCKRLKQFTLEELEIITETDKNVLMSVLGEFIAEKKLSFKNGIYYYQQLPPKADDLKNENITWVHQDEAYEIAQTSLNALRQRCQVKKIEYQVKSIHGRKVYFFDKEKITPKPKSEPKVLRKIKNLKTYETAMPLAKAQADKYLVLLKACENVTEHKALHEFAQKWNAEHPDFKTCYNSIDTMRLRFKKYGIDGLVRQRNQRFNVQIQKRHFEYFKKLYFQKPENSAAYCYKKLRKYAQKRGEHENVFSESVFKKKFISRIPEEIRSAKQKYLFRKIPQNLENYWQVVEKFYPCKEFLI